MRKLVVHFHIFKNAGSTVDHILENTFGKRWAKFDKAEPATRIDSGEFARFVDENPHLIAVSSHQLPFPVPQVDNISLIPIVFFRHPIDRIRSVYDFERRQGLAYGPVSKGADHASRLSFVDYLRWRLDTTANGVVHNHQTVWMNFNRKLFRYPILETDFDQVYSVVNALPFFGIVERFDDSIALLRNTLNTHDLDLELGYEVQNRTQSAGDGLDKRLELMRYKLGEGTWHELIERNSFDLRLYDLVNQEFDRRLCRESISHAGPC